jgi:hypothetical protein
MLALLQSSHVYFIGIRTGSLIAWLIVGLIAGWIAGTVTRGRGFGCIVDIILGQPRGSDCRRGRARCDRKIIFWEPRLTRSRLFPYASGAKALKKTGA